MLDLIKDNIVLGLVLINLFRFNLCCIVFSRGVYATRMAQSNSRGNVNFNLVFVIMAGAMVAR